jgi:hypothetical protein
MPEETLEQVRLLSNLETSRHKLLQIVLFGQPELDGTLGRTSLRQLKDRITHAFAMRPLSAAEVAAYISFRMRGAGYRGPEVFTPRAVVLIARASGGLTRRINILADKSLLAAFTEDSHAITERHARAAIADSEFGAAKKRNFRPALYAVAALIAGVALGVGVQSLFIAPDRQPHPTQPAAVGAPPVPQAPPAQAPPAPQQAAAAGEPTASAPGAPPASAPEPPVPQQPPVQPPPAPQQAAAASEPPAPAQSAPQASAPEPPRRPAPLLTRQQLRRIGAYRPADQPLLVKRLAATRERLDHADGGRYAIELFITDNTEPARMERFLARARDLVPLEEVFVIPMPEGARMRLRVVYGEFASREEAAAAQRRLPPRYQQAFRTSLRRFAELRSQI